MIVEDHAAMRALIRTVVGSLADIVHECGTGKEAVAAYTTLRPDMVLMDIAMPEVDGLTATRQIRAMDPQASVVIVTDYDAPELREQAQLTGVRAYVVKERLLDIQDLLKQASEI